jgi:hypothetical protein
MALINIHISGKKKCVTFLDLLIQSSQDGDVLTDMDIQEEVDTFLFAVSNN